MQTVLIVIHLMIVLTLVAVVLLQRSEGGALGMGGGGFMTGRGQANVLTRATAILAALFFATSLGLTLLAHYGRSDRSILEGVTPGQSEPAPNLPPKGQGNVFDQLRKIEEQRAGGGAPARTATPASPAGGTTSSGSRPPAAAPVEPTGVPDKPATSQPSTPKAPATALPATSAPAASTPSTPAPASK